MCLIAVAHRVSERFPLVIAANRDEVYDRPSLPAQQWEGEAIIGGRDALHGGSWLAITAAGRWAAVTNLRGSIRTDQPRSRGALVSEFVRGEVAPLEYLTEVSANIEQYGGFHLLAGIAGHEVGQLSGDIGVLPSGIHGLSNAPPGVRWPKVDTAVDALRGALEGADAESIVDSMMRVLRTEPSHGDPTRDLFITGDLYGTRASTLVVVVYGGDVRFIEQNYGRGGSLIGGRTELRFSGS